MKHHKKILKDYFERVYNLDAVEIIEDVENLNQNHPLFKKFKRVEVSDEIENYLNLRLSDPLTDPILWWDLQKLELPKLYKIALNVLAIQSTSVPSERCFSGGRQTVTDFRGALTGESIRELQCLKSWFRNEFIFK